MANNSDIEAEFENQFEKVKEKFMKRKTLMKKVKTIAVQAAIVFVLIRAICFTLWVTGLVPEIGYWFIEHLHIIVRTSMCLAAIFGVSFLLQFRSKQKQLLVVQRLFLLFSLAVSYTHLTLPTILLV